MENLEWNIHRKWNLKQKCVVWQSVKTYSRAASYGPQGPRELKAGPGWAELFDIKMGYATISLFRSNGLLQFFYFAFHTKRKSKYILV